MTMIVIDVVFVLQLYINISGYYYDSYEEIKELMNTEIAKLDPGATPLPWAMFFGWDPELIPNMPTLSANFLDGFSTTFPVAVIGQSGHVAWVNHKAFEVRTMGPFVVLIFTTDEMALEGCKSGFNVRKARSIMWGGMTDTQPVAVCFWWLV